MAPSTSPKRARASSARVPAASLTCLATVGWLLWLASATGIGCAKSSKPVAIPEALGPRIVFDETSHDFGAALAGDKLVHVFSFHNTGDRPLTLGALAPNCACITVAPDRKEIPPGEGGHIEIRFDSEGYSGVTRNTIKVMSNDKATPRVVLTVSATVELPLDFEPHYFKLITDDPAYRTQRIWITGRYADQVQLKFNHIEGDTIAAKTVTVRPFREKREGKSRPGIEFAMKVKQAPPGSGTAVIDTGLANPAQLAIEFTWGDSVKLRGK